MAVLLCLAPLVLSACANYASADYARAACADLAALVRQKSPNGEVVARGLQRAAARAQRSAGTDGAFRNFYAQLSTVRDLGANDPTLSAATQRRVDSALTDVARTCAELGSPVEPAEGSVSELTWSDLNGS